MTKLYWVAILVACLVCVCASAQDEPTFVAFSASDFDQSTLIDNEWMPMQPGSYWVFEGSTVEDGETIERRIEFTVTDLVKDIEGVETLVAYINDYADGELVESELAFYAQDKQGSVWYFGEYPEEYEEGEFVIAKPWIAGIAGAKPGLKMSADPQPNTPSYYQGWGPAVEWSDYGKVMEMGQETCVALDCYSDVLVIHESSLEEENAFQVKYYVRGVGDVRVGWLGDDESQEELELTRFAQLAPEELAKANEAALALEQSAYQVSPDVYGLTAPAELR